MSLSNCNSRADRRARWAVPALCVVFGTAYLVIGLANGRPGFGIGGLVIMLAYGAGLIVFRRRAEPAALLSGDVSDERRVTIQLRSGALAGEIVIVAIVTGLFWSLAADNRYVGVFSTLAAIGGLSYLASTFWYARRT